MKSIWPAALRLGDASTRKAYLPRSKRLHERSGANTGTSANKMTSHFFAALSFMRSLWRLLLSRKNSPRLVSLGASALVEPAPPSAVRLSVEVRNPPRLSQDLGRSKSPVKEASYFSLEEAFDAPVAMSRRLKRSQPV